MPVFALPFFGGGGDTRKSLLGFLSPANARHVLKFRKDPFRGVDEIGSKKEHLQNTVTPYGGDQQPAKKAVIDTGLSPVVYAIRPVDKTGST